MASSLWTIEKSLLTGIWESATEQAEEFSPSITRSTCRCDFKEVLTSPDAKKLLRINLATETDSGDIQPPSPDQRLLHDPFSSLLSVSKKEPQSEHEELIRLSVAIACLHGFVQTNWTGPDLGVQPLDVLSLAEISNLTITEDSLNQKAVAELSLGGEPCYHLAKHATFLRLALILFNLPYHHCHSVPWWRLRAALVHQQTLDEPVVLPASIFSDLEPIKEAINNDHDPGLHGRLLLEIGLTHHHVDSDKAAAESFVQAAQATGLEYELSGALGKRTKFQQTELSQLVLLAESHLKSSDGNEASNNSSMDSGTQTALANKVQVPDTLPLNDDTLLEQTIYTSSSTHERGNTRLSHLDPSSQPALHPLDQCILLSLCLNVKNTSPVHGLTSERMSPYIDRVISHPRNWTIHTMALLLRARLESTRTRTIERAVLQLQALIDQMPTADSEVSERLAYFHEIELPSKWDMEKELAHRFLSLGVVRSAMEIFERLEMWEEVVKCWQAIERPEKAITIVKDLLEGRKVEAEAVINQGKDTISAARRQVLDVTREAKLWCLLGDLEPENAVSHYERAWRVSKQTSGRAVRSLGGYHFARANWAEAVANLKKAVVINPLLSRSWFILGCSYVKLEDWEGARNAFARCVSIDDEDGESWNNLASTYLRLGQVGKALTADGDGNTEEATITVDQPTGPSNNTTISHADEDEESAMVKNVSIPFSNKLLAFRALKQGLKFSYENWRMWYNYMIVAMDVGELAESARALRRVVEQTSMKSGSKPVIDEDVLERLVSAVTKGSAEEPEEGGNAEGGPTINGIGGSGGGEGGRGLETNVDGGHDIHQVPHSLSAPGSSPTAVSPNEGYGLLKNVLGLIEDVILPRHSSSPRVFRAYARLLTWQGRWEDAVKAHLDAYRCRTQRTDSEIESKGGAGGGLEEWREQVREVEDIVDILRNFGPKVEEEQRRGQQARKDGKERDAFGELSSSSTSNAETADGGANPQGDPTSSSTSVGGRQSRQQWKGQARSIVRTFMAKNKEYYGDEPEWERLVELLEELKVSPSTTA